MMKNGGVYYELADDVWVDGKQDGRGMPITLQMVKEHIRAETRRSTTILCAQGVVGAVTLLLCITGCIYLATTSARHQFMWIPAAVLTLVVVCMCIMAICAARVNNHPRFRIRDTKILGEHVYIVTPRPVTHRLLYPDQEADMRFV